MRDENARDDLLDLHACVLCPRRCGVDRLAGELGYCGAPGQVMAARAALHFWEEPPISGEYGSGAVFFSHCNLRCRFCQNAQISSGGFGETIDEGRLSQIMLELQDQHAHNINLVTATHYVPQVIDAIRVARAHGLAIPVVYNSSGYERPELIDALSEVVDVWLPDCKYHDRDLARKLSSAADYPEVAMAAIGRMVEHVRSAGGRSYREDQTMARGIIVRHLVLPGHADDSCATIAQLWREFGNDVDLSVMNQYTPPQDARAEALPAELRRPLADDEYEQVLDFADMLGFEELWWQQGGTVSESFIPAFDSTGVKASAALEGLEARS